ncbi:MAG: bifunctional (p)ppGpp synthetase/guanosine-3',5'-bis(diphosphate) 3'-pyrophosphohydrolase [Defluviitaleaceae bacterium]|nr:bifunctional (p)ppGpp synthetase/guanosine-3',5'-bis(diphosphate) 3'-pyrophosphohydrolase [Defluviitaleaceae bacterium]MCL2264013.1 bifunctional (p)ppGpp synthetase/guanosine-3',5'-bis(diphosphate) 3'-pyrophosphohydrolase [Defluviitaleaceae bacterium]
MDGVVQELYTDLICKIREYRPEKSLEMVENAFKLACDAHKTQTRKSGEPYVTHPIEVAIILAEIKADMESIAAALLHDVVEDTDYTSEDIEKAFGEEVALLVGGVTKIEKVAYVSKTERQAENYRKMFFHMSQDVRVLLVKIADRLHNMRTIGGHDDPEKQRVIAQETLDIYAPLAHRLGISKLRYELEDLGFKYSDPAGYKELQEKVVLKQSERHEVVERIMAEIRERLDADGINARVEGRPKQLYSIQKKMKSQKKTMEEIFDIYAVRVLVDTLGGCYEVLGRVHEMYMPMPGRFKDYISMKKQNGYQSLHTTLVGKGTGEPFEVQVRTFEMHAVAEYGVAAHWKYKEGGGALVKDQWLNEIMNLQRDMSDSEEFIDALRTDLDAFSERIYCFTPKGDLIQLMKGSCAIDYAFIIHSKLGYRLTGAKVNGKMVAVDHELQTGDQVEIITSSASKGPSRDWLKIVRTNTARTKIAQWFKNKGREENIRKGRKSMETVAAEGTIPLDMLLSDGREKDVLERFQCKTMEHLYASIGVGSLRERLVINHLQREYEKTLPPPSNEELINDLIEAGEKLTNKRQSGVIVKGIGDTAVRFARCCQPLPGDVIIGYVTRGRGLTVHVSNCINIASMSELDRRRLIEAEWHGEMKRVAGFHTEMRVTCNDRVGLIADISRVLFEEKVKVTAMNTRTIQSEAILLIGLEVADNAQFEFLSMKIKNVSGVCEVARVNSLSI